MDFYSRSTTWQHRLLAYTLSHFKVQSQRTEGAVSALLTRKLLVLDQYQRYTILIDALFSLPRPLQSNTAGHRCSQHPAACAGEGSQLPPSSASVPRQRRACSKRGSPRRSRWAGRGRASSQGSVRGETAPEGVRSPGAAPPPPDRHQGAARRAQGPLAPAPTTPVEAHGERRGALQAHPPLPPGRPRLPVRPRGASVPRQPGRTGAAGRASGRAGSAAAGMWRGRPGSGGAGRRRDCVTCAPGRRVPHSRGGSSAQQHKMAGAPPRSVT